MCRKSDLCYLECILQNNWQAATFCEDDFIHRFEILKKSKAAVYVKNNCMKRYGYASHQRNDVHNGLTDVELYNK